MDSKVVVITGASSGIGAALAGTLGAAGHHLVLAARRAPELQSVARQSGTEALPVVCDVTHRAEVDALKSSALDRFGQIDVWVNNAGRGIGKRVLDLTDEDFDEMMLVNVKSALYGMQVIVPYYQERGRGHLINISSFLARVPFASYRSAYSAAKAALNSLTANLRMDLAEEWPQIHVSLVMPGMVQTAFAANALGGTPPVPRGPGAPQPQTAAEVAAVIRRVIEHPQPEVYTNPASPGFARKYYEELGAFLPLETSA